MDGSDMGPKERIAYGPVPSRRLGRSIGINNIPPKYCSYSCIYCQLGRTRNLGSERKRFYGPERVHRDVEAQMRSAEEKGLRLDNLTFVPDGEPTLDIDLGTEIDMVKGLGYPVAVITNSSLLWDKDVRDEISMADLVSVKVDAVDETVWRKVNRPHGDLELSSMIEGLKDFSDQFKGSLITETMLIRGMNDGDDVIGGTADLIRELSPKIAYLTVPIRPPSESSVEIPSDDSILKAAAAFTSRGIRTVPLTEREVGDFTYTGDAKSDILAITSVHPMRKDSIGDLLERSGDGWDVVEDMVGSGRLLMTEYQGEIFFRRRFGERTS